MKKVLKKLNDILKERKIPAELSEEGEMLSLMLSEKLAGREVYGDIYYLPFSEEEKAGGFWNVSWDVLDVTDISDADWQKLCAAVAMTNPSIPAGGFGLSGYTEETAREDGRKMLGYRITIPVNSKMKEDWLVAELTEAIEMSAAVLTNTADKICI